MSAREDVLSRVRSALSGARPPGPVPRDYRTTGALPVAELMDLLTDRLVDYKAGVHRTDEAGLPAAVAAAVAAGLVATARTTAGLATTGLPPTDRPRLVVPPGLPTGWLSALDAEVVTDSGAGLSALELDALQGVITGATVAVAETGTFVLDGSPDQGRRAITLVPDLHVCVLFAAQVVHGVPEAVALLDPTRPLTWVSGPSATSDIELVRVEGVHGPRTLEVVLVA
ncbi:MAG: LUD domain-containing protein [Frankiales bacterium]|nr:LUD domain-containing protein [Frankiales bacterium]